jgi:hypothetical protein
MHLMYYLDENGKRVYTLKVRRCRLLFAAWVRCCDCDVVTPGDGRQCVDESNCETLEERYSGASIL